MEQTRVYQNQRTHDQSQPTDQTQAEQDVPDRSTPNTPPTSTSLQKTRPSQNGRENLDQNRLKSGGTDQNGIEGDQLIPAHSNTAIWVTQVTQQPGFLFPVTRTTAVPSVRRQMTEEASLSVLPPQVILCTSLSSAFFLISELLYILNYQISELISLLCLLTAVQGS